MQERDLVDIVAITCEVDAIGELGMATQWNWRHGLMHPRTRMEILHCPPGMRIDDIPMQLNGLGENVKFGLIDVLENCTPAHWDIWRNLS